MPIDYRRVLEATARAEADGRDVDTAIMEVGSHMSPERRGARGPWVTRPGS